MPKKNGRNGRPARKKLDGKSQLNSQPSLQSTLCQKPDERPRWRRPKRSPNHMEREDRDHYDDQDSYHNRSHRRSRSSPHYKEDNYEYYSDKQEHNYRQPRPILRNVVRFEEEEEPRVTWRRAPSHDCSQGRGRGRGRGRGGQD